MKSIVENPYVKRIETLEFVLSRFLKICEHRWKALPVDTPEKKLIKFSKELLDEAKS